METPVVRQVTVEKCSAQDASHRVRSRSLSGCGQSLPHGGPIFLSRQGSYWTSRPKSLGLRRLASAVWGCAVAASCLVLGACATSAEPLPASSRADALAAAYAAHPHRSCHIQHPGVEVTFDNPTSGARTWTVRFDAPTTREIESRTVTYQGITGYAANELDCLLDQALAHECPDWSHDSQVAVDLPDGRLLSRGPCNLPRPDKLEGKRPPPTR